MTRRRRSARRSRRSPRPLPGAALRRRAAACGDRPRVAKRPTCCSATSRPARSTTRPASRARGARAGEPRVRHADRRHHAQRRDRGDGRPGDPDAAAHRRERSRMPSASRRRSSPGEGRPRTASSARPLAPARPDPRHRGGGARAASPPSSWRSAYPRRSSRRGRSTTAATASPTSSPTRARPRGRRGPDRGDARRGPRETRIVAEVVLDVPASASRPRGASSRSRSGACRSSTICTCAAGAGRRRRPRRRGDRQRGLRGGEPPRARATASAR